MRAPLLRESSYLKTISGVTLSLMRLPISVRIKPVAFSKPICVCSSLSSSIVKELINAGIKSFKIEGRVKSAYYVATVIRSYRMALDEYYRDPVNYKFNEKLLEEIKKVSHRDFTTGFYFGKPTDEAQVYTTSSYIRGYDFVGLVLDYDENTKLATIEQRNRMFKGDNIEIFGPNKAYFSHTIEKMWDEEGNEIDVAPHPQQIIKMKIEKKVEPYDIIRKPRED